MHCRRTTSFTDLAINCKRREELGEERKRDTRDGRRCFTVVGHLVHCFSCYFLLCMGIVLYDQRQYHLYYIAHIGLTRGGSSSLMIKIQVSSTCFCCTCKITTTRHGMRSVLEDSQYPARGRSDNALNDAWTILTAVDSQVISSRVVSWGFIKPEVNQ
jgi:hypothetical protein